MQNIFISTIRFGAVAVLALTVFAGEAFAAPVLTPVTVSSIAETTVTLSAKVSNPGWKTTAVWFELGDNMNTMTAVGMRDVFNEGYFIAYPYDLMPGTTYYVRAAAMEGGVTVYSPVISFKTLGGASTGGAVSGVQMGGVTLNTGSQGGATSVNTLTSGSPNAASVNYSNSNTADTSAPAQKAPVKKVSSGASSVTNNASNTAAVAGAGGVLPQSLIGWVVLFIGILVMILITRMIFESIEDRKKAREEAKKLQGENTPMH